MEENVGYIKRKHNECSKSGDGLAERKPKLKFYDSMMFLDKILAKRWYMFSMSGNVGNAVNCSILNLLIILQVKLYLACIVGLYLIWNLMKMMNM